MTKEDFINTLASMFDDLDAYFLSLTQSRRNRAGISFEVIVRTLFKKLDYPFSEQQVINGKPDFILPSREHFDKNPMDCIIFTVKRTLRERWRQIVTEGTRGLGFYLATIDEDQSGQQIKEMKDHRINLVVPSEIIAKKKEYEKAPNVISYEHFFEFHLDPAVTRWRAQGII